LNRRRQFPRVILPVASCNLTFDWKSQVQAARDLTRQHWPIHQHACGQGDFMPGAY
jgi:hypothetical protein